MCVLVFCRATVVLKKQASCGKPQLARFWRLVLVVIHSVVSMKLG